MPITKDTTSGRAVDGKNEDRYLELVRQFPLRPLSSERDLDGAIDMIDSLIDQPKLSAPEQDYLDVLLQKGLVGPGTRIVAQKPLAENLVDAHGFFDHCGAHMGPELLLFDHYIPKVFNAPEFSRHRREELRRLDVRLFEQNVVPPDGVSAHASPKGVCNWLVSHALAVAFVLGGYPREFVVKKCVLRTEPWSVALFGPSPARIEFEASVKTDNAEFELICEAGKGQSKDLKLAVADYWSRVPGQLEFQLASDNVSTIGHTEAMLTAIARRSENTQRFVQSLPEAVRIVECLEMIYRAGQKSECGNKKMLLD